MGTPPSSPSPASVTAAPGSRRERRRRGRWRLPVISLLIAVASVIGVGLLLYPAAAAWFSQYAQSERIGDYADDIRDLGADTLRSELERARDYNAAIVGGGADIAANERLPLADGSGGSAEYDGLLAADSEGLMARLKIPAIDLDLPIYHGTSETVLHRGVGHLQGTALPVGGEATHSVLTAHRGLATSELFTRLDEVGEGDTFTVEVFGEVVTYEVVETQVVQPEETETLLPQRGRDLMTLVTCTPLGINSHRILVTGERVIPTPQADLDAQGRDPEIPTFPWWAVAAGAAVCAAGGYVWLAGRPVRPR